LFGVAAADELPPLAQTGAATPIAASAPTVATAAARQMICFKIFSFSAVADWLTARVLVELIAGRYSRDGGLSMPNFGVM
jgi:hypothetical protein